ncbi:MAG TPA: RecX family transcriptional regulator [Alphaproteobacteria bacterium]|nr:RecX family transcriptional regulator [Alphaproteobacteria bacterium]
MTNRDRTSRSITPERLERAALAYLERFASSAEKLRRVLHRRLRRAGLAPRDPAYTEAAGWIEALLSRYRRSGILDDRAYAEARAARLYRRGAARGQIARRLAADGVDQAVIDAALADLRRDTGGDDADLVAAAILVRRRRLGPYRAAGARADFRQKDLAVLARAGFAFETARRVIDADSAEKLEQEIRDEAAA